MRSKNTLYLYLFMCKFNTKIVLLPLFLLWNFIIVNILTQNCISIMMNVLPLLSDFV